MQAVIIAAGKGMRMRPLTLNLPKPLLRVMGKSILERNLEQLQGLVDEVILVIGYKGEAIKKYFG
ncbi:MAG: NTP transferase domain-containing protein, partial [bacterium]|nr:NTP transferase domain-containing protein [bacterium]